MCGDKIPYTKFTVDHVIPMSKGGSNTLDNMEEMIEEQNNILTRVMDNMTLTTTQQGRLQRAVKDRVNHLLGGAHSKEYKENSKLYFINLWGRLKEKFNCGSRWQDLNPRYYNEAFDYVSTWEYVEV